MTWLIFDQRRIAKVGPELRAMCKRLRRNVPLIVIPRRMDTSLEQISEAVYVIEIGHNLSKKVIDLAAKTQMDLRHLLRDIERYKALRSEQDDNEVFDWLQPDPCWERKLDAFVRNKDTLVRGGGWLHEVAHTDWRITRLVRPPPLHWIPGLSKPPKIKYDITVRFHC